MHPSLPTNKLQGVHNLSVANHVIHDPLLTDLGNEQCVRLRQNFPFHDRIDLVTASPLRRTIYTALQSFEPVFERRPDLKLLLLPDAQETSDVACDTGSDPDVLRKEIEDRGLPVDMEYVKDGWNNKVVVPFCTERRHLCMRDRINDRSRMDVTPPPPKRSRPAPVRVADGSSPDPRRRLYS